MAFISRTLQRAPVTLRLLRLQKGSTSNVSREHSSLAPCTGTFANQIQKPGTHNRTSFVLCKRNQATLTKQGKQRGFVPRKAALNLSEKARKFCKLLLENAPDKDVIGILLKYQPATDGGQMRMVFSFDFAREKDIGPEDEGVSLEVMEDDSPKPPSESDGDGLPKLYIHHTAFMKVLGGTVDVEIEEDGSFTPVMWDREGNALDPNN